MLRECSPEYTSLGDERCRTSDICREWPTVFNVFVVGLSVCVCVFCDPILSVSAVVKGYIIVVITHWSICKNLFLLLLLFFHCFLEMNLKTGEISNGNTPTNHAILEIREVLAHGPLRYTQQTHTQ